MDFALTIIKDTKYNNHFAFLRVMHLQNSGYDIIVRHIKPLPNESEPSLEILGKARDSGFIEFEYQSILQNTNGKNFSLKFSSTLNETTEKNLLKYLEEQSKMIAFAQNTIQNIRTILQDTEMAHYIM